MTTIAARARAAAMNVEAKKHAYRQTQDGVVVSFVLHPQEVPDGLAVAPLGTRYVLALVEVGDDEQPKGGDADAHLQSAIVAPPVQCAKPGRAPVAPEKRLAQRAGILCNDPVFHRFIKDNHLSWMRRHRDITGKDDIKELAADLVREVCGVDSRSGITPNSIAGDKLDKLYSRFIAWRDVPAEVG